MTVISTYDQVPQINRPGGVPGLPRPRSPVGPSSSAGGITGKEILQTIRKRVWLIVIVFAVCVTVACVANVVWMNTAPFYTAEAFLGINPPNSPLASSFVSNVTSREVMDRFAASWALMVKTEPVANRALAKEEIRKTAWYSSDTATSLQRLLKEIEVSPRPNTDLIRVSMTGRNKNDVASIVNAVADAAEEDSRMTSGGALQQQIKNLKDEKKAKEDELADVRAKKKIALPRDIPMIEETRNSLSIKLNQLITDITRLELDKTKAQQQVERLEKSDMRNSAEVVMSLQSDQSLVSLRAAKVNMETQRDNLRAKFGPNHRSIQDVESRLKSINSQIEEREQQVLVTVMQAYRNQYESALESTTRQLLEETQQLEALKASTRGLENSLAEIRNLSTLEESLQERVKLIDNKLLELGLMYSSDPPLHLRRGATTPLQPSYPTWNMMIVVGVVLGLVLGFGLAFLLEFMDTSVKSPSDISRRTDLPVLGMIPHADDLEEDIQDLRLALMSNPNSLIGESFRQIRTCLLFSGPASQRRSLLITSALPEDGRTMVSINLATAIARGGRKVLVVDANFRQPAIHKLFPQVKEGGLSNALTGQAKWQDLVCEVEPNLAVLSSGPLPPNPAELLGSDQMRQTIAEMSAQYDQVIFDGAPALVVSDSPILSTLVDGVVLVVRAGTNTYGIVQRTKEMFSRVTAHVLGVALNGVRVTAGGYLRKSYETFYDYHEPAQLPGSKD